MRKSTSLSSPFLLYFAYHHPHHPQVRSLNPLTWEAWHGCQIARLFLDIFISASSSLVRATSIILPEALLEIHLESWTLQLGSVNNATSYFKYFCLLTKTIMPSRERYPSEALQWISSIVNWFFQVILAALDSLGIADNTIIFFTSGTLSKTTEDQSSRI